MQWNIVPEALFIMKIPEEILEMCYSGYEQAILDDIAEHNYLDQFASVFSVECLQSSENIPNMVGGISNCNVRVSKQVPSNPGLMSVWRKIMYTYKDPPTSIPLHTYYVPIISEIWIKRNYYEKLCTSNYSFDKIIRLLSMVVLRLAGHNDKNHNIGFDPYREAFNQLVIACQYYCPISESDCISSHINFTKCHGV